LKIAFACTDDVLGALAVVDVGEQAVPTSDLSVRVAPGQPANLKPTVDAIETSNARFEVVRLAGRDSPFKGGDENVQIVRVDRPVGAAPRHLLQWLAAVLDKLVVDGSDLARGRQHGHQARDAVQDQE